MLLPDPPAPTLRIDLLDAPMAVCTPVGEIRAATPEARGLLGRLDTTLSGMPFGLWRALDDAGEGNAIEWRPEGSIKLLLGCTRYRCGDEFLVLMKEVSHKHQAASQRFHRQRLEAIGGLVASIAHELRNSIASIVYNADVLTLGTGRSAPQDEALEEIIAASRRLRHMVDGLLDFAKLGPSVSVPVSLVEVFTRAQAVLRSLYREGRHQVGFDIGSDAEWVQGNSLTVEQVFVNLLVNAAQAAPRERFARVAVRADRIGADPEGRAVVRVRVHDDGPGVPHGLRESVFEPFVTTRPDGTGLGLTNAREAVESLGGSIHIDGSAGEGACFVVHLPAAAPTEGSAK